MPFMRNLFFDNVQKVEINDNRLIINDQYYFEIEMWVPYYNNSPSVRKYPTIFEGKPKALNTQN